MHILESIHYTMTTHDMFVTLGVFHWRFVVFENDSSIFYCSALCPTGRVRRIPMSSSEL